MKKYGTAILTFLGVALIITVFSTIDYGRFQNDKEPIFCVEVARYDDGGSIKYVGLFYNYYSIKQLTVDEVDGNYESDYLIDKAITPWFFSIDYAKRKTFD